MLTLIFSSVEYLQLWSRLHLCIMTTASVLRSPPGLNGLSLNSSSSRLQETFYLCNHSMQAAGQSQVCKLRKIAKIALFKQIVFDKKFPRSQRWVMWTELSLWWWQWRWWDWESESPLMRESWTQVCLQQHCSQIIVSDKYYCFQWLQTVVNVRTGHLWNNWINHCQSKTNSSHDSRSSNDF